VSCAICEKRKEKRFCLAVHGQICAQCCGEQREVTLECPSECVYLQQARQHEKPRAAEDFQSAELFLKVEMEDRFIIEHEHLLMGLSYALAKCVRADRSLSDRDLIAALTALAKSAETRANSGLHYEAPPTNPAQQSVSTAVQKMLSDYRAIETQEMGYSRLRDAQELQMLVFLVRTAHSRSSGRPRSRAFADFLLGQFADDKTAISEAGTGSSIIVP